MNLKLTFGRGFASFCALWEESPKILSYPGRGRRLREKIGPPAKRSLNPLATDCGGFKHQAQDVYLA
jgi:hypothetical protein